MSVAKIEIIQILPLFMVVCERRMECLPVHLIEFLGPALENITSDKQISEAVVKLFGHRILAEYLIGEKESIQSVKESLVSVLTNLVLNCSQVSQSQCIIECSQVLFEREFTRALENLNLSLSSNLVVLIVESISVNHAQLEQKVVLKYLDGVASYFEILMVKVDFCLLLFDEESDFSRLLRNILGSLVSLKKNLGYVEPVFENIMQRLVTLDGKLPIDIQKLVENL